MFSRKQAVNNSTVVAKQQEPQPASRSTPASPAQQARRLPGLSTYDILQLQRSIGNRATGRLLAQRVQHQPIQAKKNNTEAGENAISEEQHLEKELGHAGQIQRKPVPVKDTNTDVGSKYVDDVSGINLIKINEDNGFLFRESHILFWSGKNYLSKEGKLVKPEKLEEDQARVLEVAMGELGVIDHSENPEKYTHLRTSNASPCIILTIHYSNKSLMAHIHRGNTDEQIGQLMRSVPDLETTSVQLVTKEYSGKDKEELEIQKKRYNLLHKHFSAMKSIHYETRADQENLTMDAKTGKSIFHKDGTEPQDLSFLSAVRSLANEKRYMDDKKKELMFNVRKSNVQEDDNEYGHIKPGKGLGDIAGSIMTSVQLQRMPDISAIQMVRVYNNRTRKAGDGFDEDVMYGHFKKLAKAVTLEDKMGNMGFRYAGDTESGSKANTDFATKTIRIKKDLTTEEAALSFAYELSNASQNDEFQEILKMPGSDFGSNARAKEYAEKILRKEARSVLFRSEMALAVNKPELIKNQKYNEIAANKDLSEEEKLEQTFQEMKENGKVYGGAKKAYDHYVEQFWEYNTKSVYGLM